MLKYGGRFEDDLGRFRGPVVGVSRCTMVHILQGAPDAGSSVDGVSLGSRGTAAEQRGPHQQDAI